MNLKQKEELQLKIDQLTELVKCIPDGLIFDHSVIEISKTASTLLSILVGVQCAGDRLLALNLILRMLKDLTHQISGELKNYE